MSLTLYSFFCEGRVNGKQTVESGNDCSVSGILHLEKSGKSPLSSGVRGTSGKHISQTSPYDWNQFPLKKKKKKNSMRSQGEIRVQPSLYPQHLFFLQLPNNEMDCVRNKCASWCYFAEFSLPCSPFYFAGFCLRSCSGSHFPGNWGQHIHSILN